MWPPQSHCSEWRCRARRASESGQFCLGLSDILLLCSTAAQESIAFNTQLSPNGRKETADEVLPKFCLKRERAQGTRYDVFLYIVSASASMANPTNLHSTQQLDEDWTGLTLDGDFSHVGYVTPLDRNVYQDVVSLPYEFYPATSDSNSTCSILFLKGFNLLIGLDKPSFQDQLSDVTHNVIYGTSNHLHCASY